MGTQILASKAQTLFEAYKKLYNTKSLAIYKNKLYIKYYNFYQKFKDHFAIARANC